MSDPLALDGGSSGGELHPSTVQHVTSLTTDASIGCNATFFTRVHMELGTARYSFLEVWDCTSFGEQELARMLCSANGADELHVGSLEQLKHVIFTDMHVSSLPRRFRFGDESQMMVRQKC